MERYVKEGENEEVEKKEEGNNDMERDGERWKDKRNGDRQNWINVNEKAEERGGGRRGENYI